jgi:undecaprenyl-diphosphatase
MVLQTDRSEGRASLALAPAPFSAGLGANDMQTLRSVDLWRRFDVLEHSACVRLNRVSRHDATRWLFTTVSRLGDGVFWYLLMLAFAVGSRQGALIALQMAAAALVGLAVYKQLKHRLVRERPYISHASIELGTAPLDRYSFPSGHTLHAVCLTTIAVTHVPELAVVLLPFSLLVAASRVVLGLHYPTDVAAGALLGFLIATGTLVALPV